MKAVKRILTSLLATGMALSLASCASTPADVAIANFEAPKAGDEIAVITVRDYGTFKIRFFPDQAPKGVENFVTHAKDGYYDELPFHRVIEDFMIQGGDPKGDGTGGESIWGGKFEHEASDALWLFNGAVAYANSGTDTNGSQFFVVTQGTSGVSDASYKSAEDTYGTKFPKNVKDKYAEVGGVPRLDGGYTVFAQVIEGMDVVEEISKCEVSYNASYEMSKPVRMVLVEKVEIVPYEG